MLKNLGGIKMIRSIKIAIVLAGIIIAYNSCIALRQGVAMLKTPSGFIRHNDSVNYEKQCDSLFAAQVDSVLLTYKDSVALKHQCKFKEPIQVYVCNSKETFCGYTGSKQKGPRAHVTPKGVFISPSLKGTSDWTSILYHELSHVILMQNLGLYRYSNVPIWFHEGLATMISNGGGTGAVTDDTALSLILDGKHFDPVEREFYVFPKSFENPAVSHWVHYRQAMLFVRFLKEKDQAGFQMLLSDILQGKEFDKAVGLIYGQKTHELWRLFVDKMRA
jgi:hypothetical protein